jgi:hypothetical protein
MIWIAPAKEKVCLPILGVNSRELTTEVTDLNTEERSQPKKRRWLAENHWLSASSTLVCFVSSVSSVAPC